MKENDIRPKELFNEYLRLSSQDIDSYFPKNNRIAIVCPACNYTQSQFAFKKNDFEFAECIECKTLFLSPRPPLDEFEKYYSNSPSAKFWLKEFYPVVIESRRNNIIQPNVEKIRSICNTKKIKVRTIIDVGAGHGVFLEEWRKKEPKSKLIGIEPSPELSEICQSKGIDIIPSVVEKVDTLESKAELVVCFEVIEHVHDPLLFVKVVRNMVAPGGVAIFTGLGVDGFDIQVLWEKSKSVFPPHHINFMSINGFHKLFLRSGFSEVEVITPGTLDVDITFNNQDLLEKENRFIKTLLSRGEKTLEELQSFLSRHQLSSHCWILASN